MKTITLSDNDATQVHAILMTHSEMQDHRTLDTLETIGRLQRDVPDESVLTVSNLKDHVTECEQDCDNLKRIANLFS